MNTLAIVGSGELADAWAEQNNNYYEIEVYSHNQFDLTQKNQCDQLIDLILSKDIIMITAGKFDDDLWNMWMVNLIAPAYLVSELIKKNYRGKIVVISSNAANWTSWPDITLERLTYNNSKQAISNFIYGVVQGKFAGKFSVIEPSAFKSNMSNYHGQDIKLVIEAIDFAIKTNSWNIKL